MAYAFKTMASPVGELTLIACDVGLAAVLWENDDAGRVPLGPLIEQADHPILVEAEHQLVEYFAGQRTDFSLPLAAEGTDFRKKVWRALLAIPFRETRSYADIARSVGKPNAYRAVGAAIGMNPLSIVAPCHRVIGSGGALTGFAGGLDTKRHLLIHEARKAA